MSAGNPFCDYAPRHRPDWRGICELCGQAVAEPWFVRRRPDPAELVIEIATRHGATVPRYVAAEIAAALLEYADSAVQITHTAIREAWERPGLRDHIRQDMRRQLLDEVAKQGLIPAASPSEALRYFMYPLFNVEGEPGSGEVPPAAADQTDWQIIQVILAVPVRTPSIDRAAAVRAGVL